MDIFVQEAGHEIGSGIDERTIQAADKTTMTHLTMRRVGGIDLKSRTQTAAQKKKVRTKNGIGPK
jgi:hypothetical protein